MERKKFMKKNTSAKKGNGIKIHLLKNGGVCECCGEKNSEDIFLAGMCDAHTHGMEKKGFTELQMVLAYPDEYIAYIINTVADRIMSGKVVEEDGKIVENIFEDGAGVRLDRNVDSFGDDVFRIIIPDGKFRMPEDSDEYPYNLQDESPYREDHPEGA